jgi:hypothetical protein
MMEAASTSETSVNYQTTQRNNPEDSHLHTRRGENLKSHIASIFSPDDGGCAPPKCWYKFLQVPFLRFRT